MAAALLFAILPATLPPCPLAPLPPWFAARNCADAASEKEARGALLSAMDRYLNRRTTLIFDTQNNIKGYRYQLWCCARSVSWLLLGCGLELGYGAAAACADVAQGQLAAARC